MRKILLVAICCLAIGGCATYNEPQTTSLVTEEPEVISTPKPTRTPRPTKTPTPVPTATPEPTATPTAEQKKQIEEVFKATCREYADDTYERLMREDTKSGTRLCLEVEVVQKMDSLFSDYYRVSGTMDAWNEEYIICDYREEKDTKILVGDTLTIYGEFDELEEFERSLTGNTVEIPVINAKYIVFPDLEEKEPTPTPKQKVTQKTQPTEAPKPALTPTPIPYCVEFNQSGEVFSSYNYMNELEGSVRIDSISYEFDEYGDLTVYLKGQVIECSDDFYITYRLYDEEDYVIEDGWASIDGLKEGDKFKNKYIVFYDIEKADYRLELSDG